MTDGWGGKVAWGQQAQQGEYELKDNFKMQSKHTTATLATSCEQEQTTP